MNEYHAVQYQDAVKPDVAKPETPNWMPYCQFMMEWMLLMALLRISYELKRPKLKFKEEEPFNASTQTVNEAPQINALSQQEQIWSAKASKNYAQAQRKKWQKWKQAMYEKKDSQTPEGFF